MVSELKRLLTHRMEENLHSYISYKGLITRICRELKNLNSLKINGPIKKLGIELSRTFQGKKSKWLKKRMKKCSPSLAIKEMQIKTTLRYHLTGARVVVIKNTTNNKYWQRCGDKATLIHCWCMSGNEWCMAGM
jgi:hypothetical protein